MGKILALSYYNDTEATAVSSGPPGVGRIYLGTLRGTTRGTWSSVYGTIRSSCTDTIELGISNVRPWPVRSDAACCLFDPGRKS